MAAFVRSEVGQHGHGQLATPLLLTAHGHSMRTGLATMLMLALLFAAVWVYRGRGQSGQLVIMAYLGSLVATQASVTVVFKTYPSFQAPCLLTACQLLFQVLASQTVLQLRDKGGFGAVALIQEMGVQEWLQAFFPVAFCMTFAVLAHNASIMYIGLGLSSIMSALTPTVTALMCMAFGQRYPTRAWVGMAIVCFGALVTMNGIHLERADRRKAAGCALAFAALICRAMKTTLQDLLMRQSREQVQAMLKRPSAVFGPASYGAAGSDLPEHSAAKDVPEHKAYDPLQVWALQSPLMFMVCATTSLWLEGSRPWNPLLAPDGLRRQAGLIGACLFSAVVSCFLGITALTTVKLLGAAAAQIVGKLNIIITAVFAMTIMDEDVGHAELVGGIILVLGAYIFEREAHNYRPAAASSPSPAKVPQPQLAAPAAGDREEGGEATASTAPAAPAAAQHTAPSQLEEAAGEGSKEDLLPPPPRRSDNGALACGQPAPAG